MKLFVILALLALASAHINTIDIQRAHRPHAHNHSEHLDVEEEASKIGDIFHKIGKAVGIAIKVAGAIAEEENMHLPTHHIFRPHFNKTVVAEEEASKIGDIFHKIGKAVGIAVKVAGAIAEEENMHLPTHHVFRPHFNKTVVAEEEASKIGNIFHKIGQAVGVGIKIAKAVAEEENLHINKEKIEHVVHVVGDVAGKISQIANVIAPHAEEEAIHINKEKIEHVVHVVGDVAGKISQIANVIAPKAEEEALHINKEKIEHVVHVVGDVAGKISQIANVIAPHAEEEASKIGNIFHKIGQAVGVGIKIAKAVAEEEEVQDLSHVVGRLRGLNRQ